jgi:hypothetical protein
MRLKRAAANNKPLQIGATLLKAALAAREFMLR